MWCCSAGLFVGVAATSSFVVPLERLWFWTFRVSEVLGFGLTALGLCRGRVSVMGVPLTVASATAALMIKDGRIAELEAELRAQRTLLVEHAGRLNNRIKLLEAEVDRSRIEVKS